MSSRLKDRRRRHDRFYRQAKQRSYAARSAFKLQEIDQRFRLFRPRQRILDLGCRPGSWIQYALERIGPEGRVVGLDREPLNLDLGAQCRIVLGDVMEIEPSALRGDLPCFHVVLSDMAPDTSGVAFSDQVRSAALLTRAFEIAGQVGCPKGALVGKVLMGSGFEEAWAEIKRAYARTKIVRPDATRKESTEVYVVALERRS
jgi:23S rRNA (uridine2552-2'-O)-methyltransferase